MKEIENPTLDSFNDKEFPWSATEPSAMPSSIDSLAPKPLLDFSNARDLLFLAPLAGYTDLPFRNVVKKFGVDITVSEMISSHALAYSSAKTIKMLEKSSIETPFSAQISGSKPEVLKRAIEVLNAQKGIDIVDFNCGCPAPKVANHGNGSGLLKDLSHLVTLLHLIREHTTAPYTSVKVRLGFDIKIPEEIANALNDAPIDFVVIHGRTRSDGYKKERIDYDAIALMNKILRVPVIANGEIDSATKAYEVLHNTGANGVMIGRAALVAPWIFWQIRHKTEAIPYFIKKDLVLEHFNAMVQFYGERGVVMFRKNLHAYAKGHSGASAFRQVVNTLSDSNSMRVAIEDFFGDCLQEWAIEPLVELNKRSV